MGLLGWLGLGLGIALIANSGMVKDHYRDDEDRDEMEDVLDNKKTPLSLLANDTSPMYFQVPGGELTAEQRLALVTKISADYKNEAERIAAKMVTDSTSVFNAVAVLLEGSNGALTERAVDLYFKILDVWAARFDTTVKAVVEGIAKVIESTNNGVNLSKVCTATTFVKNSVETSDVTDSQYYNQTYKNSSTKVVLGIVGSGKSNTQSFTTLNTMKSVQTRSLTFIPHCTEWQMDPAQLAATLANGLVGIRSQFAILQIVLKQCPDPAGFVR